MRKRGIIHGKMAKLWLEWDSTTTQQARNKANGEYIWRQNLQKWEDGSVEFSEIHAKMRSKSRQHCGWSSASTTTQKYETGEKPSWNVCSNGHDTELIHWYYPGLRVLSKNVGVTNCRRQLKLYTSVKVGHSRTSNLFYQRFSEYVNIAQTTFIQ